MVTRSNPTLGHGKVIKPRRFFIPALRIITGLLPQIFTNVITVQQSGRNVEDQDWFDSRLYDLVFGTDQIAFIEAHDDVREEYDDDWVFDRLVDNPPVLDISEQIWFVYPDEDIREEYDDDLVFFYFADVFPEIISSVISVQARHPSEDDDFWSAYGQTDVVVIPDISELIRVIFLDDDAREEFEDDLWNAYGQFDLNFLPLIITSVISVQQAGRSVSEGDDFWSAYGQFDTPRVQPAIISSVISIHQAGRRVEEDGFFDAYAQVDTPVVPPPLPPPSPRTVGSQTYIVRNRWNDGWTASRYRRGYSNG